MTTKKARAHGRHAGKPRIAKEVGRPKIPDIDRIAAKAWFQELKRVTKAKTAAEAAKMGGESTRGKHFTKYARGAVTPSSTTLINVDNYLTGKNMPAIRAVFDDGPEGVPLWDALSGNFEALWRVIYHTYPTIPRLEYPRIPHEKRVDIFISSILPGLDLDTANTNPRQDSEDQAFGIQKIIEDEEHQLLQLSALENNIQKWLQEKNQWLNYEDPANPDFIAWHEVENNRRAYVSAVIGRRKEYLREILLPLSIDLRMHPATAKAKVRHSIKELLDKQQLDFGFPQLAATIALWRICMMVADSADKMEYVINGLMENVIPAMLKPYGVAGDVIDLLTGMGSDYHKWVGKMIQTDSVSTHNESS